MEILAMESMTGSAEGPMSGLERFFSGSLIVWLLSMLLGAAAVAPDAQAQQGAQRGPGGGRFMVGGGGPGGLGGGGRAGGRGMWEPPLSSKDLERYAATLELNADQLEAATMLLEAMQQEFGAAAQEARQQMDDLRAKMRESREPSIAIEKIPAVMSSMRERRAALDEAFMADLRLLLDGPQAELWPTLERMRRRESELNNGMLSGESVDLVRLVSDLNATPEQKAGAMSILDQYELDIDRALQARREKLDRVQARVGTNIANIEALAQDEEFRKLREDVHDARMQVRNTNRRYARQLAAALPPAVAAELGAEFQEASFPQVYRDSFADRSVDAAEGFEDLTPEQRAALEALRAQMAAELASARERLAAAIDKADEQGGALAFGMGGMRMDIRTSDDGGADPASEARAAKDQVEQKYLESLRNLLSDTQRDRLPKPRERGRRMRLPGGREIALEGGDDGEGVGAVFITDDGQANVMILRGPGGGEPPPEGANVRVIREIHDDGEGNVEEFEFVEHVPPESGEAGGSGDKKPD